MFASRHVGSLTAAILLSAFALPMHAQQTVAEKTNGAKTGSFAQVVSFVDSLIARAPTVLRKGVLTTTVGGKVLPYVIAARPMVATPAAAKQSGKPLIYIEANIHSGEVEGKEAMQAMLRELAVGSLKPLLDSVILIVVPIYNADGNDKFGHNRPGQNGPDSTGTRTNGMNLNLNRDFVKAATPETKGTLALVAAWDPDMFMDLHTSNGSYHGYGLTYAQGLNPNPVPSNVWIQDVVLPEVRNRLRKTKGLETFPYGNFRDQKAPELGWDTYESFPRYGTNLMGMTRMSILTEAYSNDPFLTRIKSTYDFVLEVVRYLAEHKTKVRDVMKATVAFRPDSVIVRSTFAPPRMDTIIAETVTPGGQVNGQFVRSTRTGQFVKVVGPVVDRFVGTRKEAMPAGYFLDAKTNDTVIAMLRRQGIVVERLTAAWSGAVQHFMVDSVAMQRANEGVRTSLTNGAWEAAARDTLAVGTFFIPTAQHAGVLAAFLLEPASEDGYSAWNLFDDGLKSHALHPIRRVMTLPTVQRSRVP